MKTIDNINQMIAARELCRQIIADNDLTLPVFDAVYPNKNLPEEFLVVKSVVQSDDGRPWNTGTVEICIYAANLKWHGDSSRPNLDRLMQLTDAIVPRLKEAIEGAVAFNDLRMTLVSDSDINYFYQSIVMNTVSINI